MSLDIDTIIDLRDDEKNGFLGVSGCTARLTAYQVFSQLDRDPGTFLKKKKKKVPWMATSQTVKVSLGYFSNRLSSFLITCQGIWPKIHALYDSQATRGSGYSIPTYGLRIFL
jgi:hypothetical protein